MTARIQLYLFDIDGTLLLTGGAGSAALDHVFETRYGLRGAMDGVSPAGKTDPMIITEVFETRMGRKPADHEVTALLAAYVPSLHLALGRVTRFRLMPAVIETLDFLATEQELCLGVATGNVRDGARAKLEYAGLWHRFALGGYGDDSPDRGALVQRAIDRAHDHVSRAIPRESIVVVGDTPRDVAAARACGVRVIAVATGSVPRDALAATEPDAVFDTLAELPAWHQRENG